jgi:uncharacterized protein (DUF1778 family)
MLPADSLRVFVPPAPPRKVKTITFRLKDELYEVLSEAAEQNNMTLSSLVAFALDDYLRIQGTTHKKARFLNTLNGEERNEILESEKKYPPEFRDFTLAEKDYPQAEKFSPEETGARVRKGKLI